LQNQGNVFSLARVKMNLVTSSMILEALEKSCIEFMEDQTIEHIDKIENFASKKDNNMINVESNYLFKI